MSLSRNKPLLARSAIRQMSDTRRARLREDGTEQRGSTFARKPETAEPSAPKPRVGGATGQRKPLNDFSRKVRADARDRSGGVCEACGQERATTHHHRRPRRRDGYRASTNALSNDLHIGRSCDERIERQDRVGALALGQLLHADQDPAASPVLYRGQWVLLGDDKSVTPCDPPEEAAA